MGLKVYTVTFNDFSFSLDLVAKDVIDASKKALRHKSALEMYEIEEHRKVKASDINHVDWLVTID